MYMHEPLMARALELARKAWGETHPNPMVGALIVEAGEVVAEGWHHAAGQAHAEVDALNALGRKPAADAILYVTLEPCSTCGRTGACTTAIIESGIQTVVVGACDPNPAHAGHGLEVLREAGVQVVEGVLAAQCTDLNLTFNHWIVEQTPFLAAKLATTLDGKFAASNGHSKWVTNDSSRLDVMRWRRYFPAIAVSAATVLADDPSLTSRIDGEIWCSRRFVFDRSLVTVDHFSKLKLFTDSYAAHTTVVCSDVVDTSALERRGLSFWKIPEIAGHLSLDSFRSRCAAEELCGVYIESGPTLTTALIESGLIDYLFHYVAPKYMSDTSAVGIGTQRQTQSMDAAIELSQMQQESFDGDRLIRGFLNED